MLTDKVLQKHICIIEDMTVLLEKLIKTRQPYETIVDTVDTDVLVTIMQGLIKKGSYTSFCTQCDAILHKLDSASSTKSDDVILFWMALTKSLISKCSLCTNMIVKEY